MGYTKMTCVFEACKVVWRILMSKVSMMRYSSRALLFIVLWSSCCLALEGPPPSDCCSFWCGCFSISQNFFSKWATGSTLLNWWRMFHHMRHAAASQSPVFACSPGNCTSYTSHFGRRTSNKKMMMSWYPKQPDITSFKWMFLDFQPFPFLKIWNNLELSNRNNHFFQCSALGVPCSHDPLRYQLCPRWLRGIGSYQSISWMDNFRSSSHFSFTSIFAPQFRRFGHKKNHPKMSTLTRSGIWTKTIYGKHTPTISTRTNELTNCRFREHLRGANLF